MKKLLLTLCMMCAMCASAEDFSSLYLYLWDNDNQKDVTFELATTDGKIYHGTNYSLTGVEDVRGIYVVNADWSVQYGWPTDDSFELKLDGTTITLTLGAKYGGWMWGGSILPEHHIWFNSEKAELIVNKSSESPWGSSAVDELNADELPPVYYNLQGVKISQPEQGGIYIRKIGAKATKIVY